MTLCIVKHDKSFLSGDVLKILCSGIVEPHFGIVAWLGAVLTYLISTSCKIFKTKQLDQLQIVALMPLVLHFCRVWAGADLRLPM